MNTEKLENYRQQLMQQRATLAGQVNENQRQTLEMPRDDMQDPVDVAVSDRDQTILMSISESERTLLDQIDESLRRMDAGGYGECANCGTEISELRLKAVPYASFCRDCQELLESGELDRTAA